MKRASFTIVLSLVTVFGFAQQAPSRPKQTPEQLAQREANTISERLSLTEDQRAKVYSVYLDNAKKQQTAREARENEMQKHRLQDSVATSQRDNKISQVLTADQKKTFDQIKKQRSRMGRPGPQRMQGNGRALNAQRQRQFSGPGSFGRGQQRLYAYRQGLNRPGFGAPQNNFRPGQGDRGFQQGPQPQNQGQQNFRQQGPGRPQNFGPNGNRGSQFKNGGPAKDFRDRPDSIKVAPKPDLSK